MSKYVPDILSKRWVIVTPQRTFRPQGFSEAKGHVCPLCAGHEDLTPPEILRFGGGEPNKPGWKVRVVPNKFAITDIHEVIVHTPDHQKDLEYLPVSQVELILKAYVLRYNTHKKSGQVLIFCNHGEHAGASLPHPHSQLVVIPSQINLDTISREPLNNIVDENKFFDVYCPDFSQWPYEVWITPKKNNTLFGDLNEEELADLAIILQRTLKQLKKIYDQKKITHIPFGYNYYIFHKENWYLRIIPRFVHRAGFELGTGLYVNIIDPIEAASDLKGEDKRTRDILKRLKKY